MTTLPLVFLLGTFLAVLGGGGPQAPANTGSDLHRSGQAQLDVREAGASLDIRALFVSDAVSGPLTYTLEVAKEGRSRSTSRQSGDFTAESGQTTTLSTSRVSASADDEVTVTLTVSDESGVVDVARFHTVVTL